MGWQGNAPVCRRRLDHLAAYPCRLVLFGAVGRRSWMERWMDENDAETLEELYFVSGCRKPVEQVQTGSVSMEMLLIL